MAGRTFTYLVVAAPGQAEQVILWDTIDITFGREAGQDVVLDDPEVSRAHARFAIEDRVFSVADLGTANGTFVNGVRVATHALRPGDEIQLGEAKIVFRQEAESPLGHGSDATFASQLKGFGGPGAEAAESGRTMLGVAPGAAVEGMSDEFADLGPVGEAAFEFGGAPAPPPVEPRNLDAELGRSETGSPATPWEDSQLGMEPLEPPPKPEPSPEPAPPPAPAPTRPAATAKAQALPAAPRPEETSVARITLALEIAGPKASLLGLVQSLLDREITVPPFKLRLRKKA